MPTATVWVTGDQLLEDHPAIKTAIGRYGQDRIIVLLIESEQRLSRQPYQRKRLVLLLSAMRHYAEYLMGQGLQVDYRKASTFTQGFRDHIQENAPDAILCMACSSYQGRLFQENLAESLGLEVEIVPNSQFLLGRYNPIPSPENEKRYVLEYFYRQMRSHFNVLMEGDEPAGGEWNFDRENRKRLPADLEPPAPVVFEPDETTLEVMAQVAAMPGGIGSVDDFRYAVDHHQARKAFEDFIKHRLDRFGPYEDAMTKRSHVLYHSMISPYLNIGLLEPLPVIRKVEALHRAGEIPIQSAEGFIRQVLGWREFMYWQYWRQMPGMLEQNDWDAQEDVPDFFWDGETDLACLAFALERAISTGYTHHIERLMLLSNFMMLTGVNPRAANDWFLSLFIDAYDWVMPPNVIGMGLNADGGLTATKPYIASANYINKMGDFCSSCVYDHKKRHGSGACPFNYLYWNFILKHQARLRANPRTSRNVLGLRYLDGKDREKVQQDADRFIRKYLR